VFSNLVHVTPELRELLETPGVRLAATLLSPVQGSLIMRIIA
jgi:hypothetical protein